MSVLLYGSSGPEVGQLQRALNATGNFHLAEDSQFGPATEQAVRDYQREHHLTVDGKVGPETWGCLNTPSSDTPSASPNISGVSTDTADALSKLSSGPTASDNTAKYSSEIDAQKANKPANYVSPYSQQIADLYSKIMNYGNFSYDVNGDALYQQYKDQYTNLGKQSMIDTQGQAAGLTGGYGSSYGQSAGQQAYDAYLQKLNDEVPELYNQAYTQYENGLSNLSNELNMNNSLDATAYGRYRDTVSDWQQALADAINQYGTAASSDSSVWAQKLSAAQKQQELENADYWNRKKYDYQISH